MKSTPYELIVDPPTIADNVQGQKECDSIWMQIFWAVLTAVAPDSGQVLVYRYLAMQFKPSTGLNKIIKFFGAIVLVESIKRAYTHYPPVFISVGFGTLLAIVALTYRNIYDEVTRIVQFRRSKFEQADSRFLAGYYVQN
jgi:hypothetical protein